MHLLGLSPLLAVADRGSVALGLALATTALLLLAAALVSLLGERLRGDWRFLGYLLLLAVLATALDVATGRVLPALSGRLGIYLPLLACNFVILTRLDDYRARHVKASLVDAAAIGARYGLALMLFALTREWLATGALFNDWQILLPQGSDVALTGTALAPFTAQAPAALLLLGLLVAAWHLLAGLLPAPRPNQNPIAAAPRARVTGKLKDARSEEGIRDGKDARIQGPSGGEEKARNTKAAEDRDEE